VVGTTQFVLTIEEDLQVRLLYQLSQAMSYLAETMDEEKNIHLAYLKEAPTEMFSSGNPIFLESRNFFS